MEFIGIILGLIVLLCLVVIHEFGHALAAKKSGVVVEEFGIGLPPTAKKKKLKSGLIFSINWLPLGGFVKLKGEYDSATQKGDYGSATIWQKTKILFAGVLANWLIAALILTVLALFGLPKIVPDQFSVQGDAITTYKPVQIVSIIDDKSADEAGLEAGDKILKFAGNEVATVDSLISISKYYQDQTVELLYERDGSENLVNITLGNESGYIIGAGLGQSETVRSTWSAPIVGLVTTAQYTWLTLESVGSVIANLFSANMQSVGDNLSGPIGILGTIFPSALKGGIVQILLLSAIVSISLAVMNILPIPALDGGRWLLMIIHRIIKKPLTKEREEKIQAVGFYALMALVVLITINDVTRLFK